MIAILKTQDNQHLGFILFSSSDNKCVFQILPKEASVFDTEIYKKLAPYSTDMERPYTLEENLITIDGVDKANIRINLGGEVGEWTFGDDELLKGIVVMKK